MNALSIDEQRLKEATRALQKAAGGVESCAEITGTGKSQHGNYQNVNSPDFITVRAVRELEAVTHGCAGHPHVTALLARMAGGVFVPMPRCDGAGDAIPAQVMVLAKELGDVSARITEGLADDGVLSAAETEAVLHELDELNRASAKLKLMLEAAAGQGVR